MRINHSRQLSRALAVATLLAFGAGTSHASTPAATQASNAKASPQAEPAPKAKHKVRQLDRSGRKQVGKASFYARRFANRKMADGTPFNLHGNNAASKTLPLGTTARVTNLETGQSKTVVVRDRGPYVPGRIIDLTPKTAQDIGITREQGVAPVEVAPIEVPLPDGGVKVGEGGVAGEGTSRR